MVSEVEHTLPTQQGRGASPVQHRRSETPRRAGARVTAGLGLGICHLLLMSCGK